MPEFDPKSPDEFYRVLNELLVAKGLSHEASILSESSKEMLAYTSESDWGVTSIGYAIKLLLPTRLYVQLRDRNICEQILKEHANEVFRIYENAWIDQLNIVIAAEVRPEVPESSYDKVCRLRSQAIAACTQDPYSGPEDYEHLRKFVLESIRFKAGVPDCVRKV